MYLKRLEIKGFKSFADKCTISLEPGISAIVGPNGSGKSNICDAILWVLGERNAKSLRGGIMEDVIFAGSAKRSAVSVAEVSLILDNSDGILPIDYNEVSVSRRLYRSGESDYLINGVSSRRLDVLDILHDSGIGTDTNSIISQGHLDSILQSKPADRRTLIEEAAGVLKHKQRKLRSQHKLERMNINLERIGDVVAEIERQLKPLRIKAKRAQAYDGLVEDLSKLTLELAVDDLKNIKSKWEDVDKQRESQKAIVDSKRNFYEEKEKLLVELRNKISTQNKDMIEYSSKQRRLNSAIEKISTYEMLMNEKAKNAESENKSINDQIFNNSEADPEKNKALSEIDEAFESIKQIKVDEAKFAEEINLVQNEFNSSAFNLKKLLDELSELQDVIKNKENTINDNQIKINKVSDSIVELQAKIASLESQNKESKSKIESYNNELKSTEQNREEKTKKLTKINSDYNDNNKQINDLTNIIEKISSELENLKSEKNDINAKIVATEKIIESSYEELSEASKWLNKNLSRFKNVKNLSDAIEVPDLYLNIVESILGSYSTSYFANTEDIDAIRNDIKNTNDTSGNLRLVSKEENAYIDKQKSTAREFAKKHNAVALIDKINILDDKTLGVLSGVVVFETSNEAFSAAKDCESIICSSLDGNIIYPDGRYLISTVSNNHESQDKESSRKILSYKNNLKKLNESFDGISKKIENKQLELTKNQQELTKLRDSELELKNNMTTINAEIEFSDKQISQLKENICSAEEKYKIDLESYNKIKKDYSDNTPDINNLKKQNEEITESLSAEKENLVKLQDKISVERNNKEEKNQKLSELKVKLAALSERLSSKNASLDAAKKRLEYQKALEEKNKNKKKFNLAIINKSNVLSGIFNNISNCAKRDLGKLDNTFSTKNSEFSEIQKESDEAINASNVARKEYEAENEKLSQIQVDLGKLEVQVQNAVDTIDSIDGISVDKALEMPKLENREEKEEQAFKIRRRIANMGTINPDAKEEYETLKERFDFLNEQLEDLHSAKNSLSKINSIIDDRMKDDFINTFDEVNLNFQEIFSVLFPGGKARLELEDPNDVDNSGVEVKAQPHGKHISKMSLLSGGERSLVALCLLFAVYKKRTTPFYILDEVEAALDDTNLRRLIKYLDNLRAKTQLIMITHQRRTMEMADVLYGVSMKNDGVTKVVSQKLEKDNKLRDIDKKEED